MKTKRVNVCKAPKKVFDTGEASCKCSVSSNFRILKVQDLKTLQPWASLTSDPPLKQGIAHVPDRARLC